MSQTKTGASVLYTVTKDEKPVAAIVSRTKIGAMVLFTCTKGERPVAAIVSRTWPSGNVEVCAFTPAPLPISNARFCPAGMPRTFRHTEETGRCSDRSRKDPTKCAHEDVEWG